MSRCQKSCRRRRAPGRPSSLRQWLPRWARPNRRAGMSSFCELPAEARTAFLRGSSGPARAEMHPTGGDEDVCPRASRPTRSWWLGARGCAACPAHRCCGRSRPAGCSRLCGIELGEIPCRGDFGKALAGGFGMRSAPRDFNLDARIDLPEIKRARPGGIG